MTFNRASISQASTPLDSSIASAESMGNVGDLASFAPLRIQELAGAACVLNVLDSLGYGSFLVDRERQVLAHNKIARDCLDDGLTLSARRLAATDRESDIRLQSSIEVALTSAEGSEGPSVSVQRRSRLPLVILMLHLEERTQFAMTSAGLVLVVCDPELKRVPPPDMLTDMFGLTPAEASVATGIAAGKHLTEIAADRDAKVETVRVHSKAVFRKTRTRGQVELALLLTRLAVLAPHQSLLRTRHRAGKRVEGVRALG